MYKLAKSNTSAKSHIHLMAVHADVFELVEGDLQAIRKVEVTLLTLRTEDSYATLIPVDQLLKVKSRFWSHITS